MGVQLVLLANNSDQHQREQDEQFPHRNFHL